MRELDEDLSAHIASGVTTLATCWILKRADGLAIGFTDHDRSISLQSVLCEPETGLIGSEMRQSNGFASDDQDIKGVLTSDRLNEADLVSGRYDGAKIETWRVNWADCDQAIMLRCGYLGEIRREAKGFQAEVRSLSIDLLQERGRVYQYHCDATLGDDRCRVDLHQAGLSFTGTVRDILSTTCLSLELSTRPTEGLLAMGQMKMTSGAAEAMRFDILTHHRQGDEDHLELWLPIHTGILGGDSVQLTIGCDKSFSCCKNRFANQLNFCGFPHIPGNDFVLSYPELSTLKDGSALSGEQI